MKLLEVIDTEETLLIIMEYLSRAVFFSYWRPKPEFEARGLFCVNHQGSGSHQVH
jgi:hypothetical protein